MLMTEETAYAECRKARIARQRREGVMVSKPLPPVKYNANVISKLIAMLCKCNG